MKPPTIPDLHALELLMVSTERTMETVGRIEQRLGRPDRLVWAAWALWVARDQLNDYLREVSA